MSESVNHPAHYGGADNPYEAIKVIEAWDLGFHLGSAVKYIARMGKKNGEPPLRDLKKAAWYVMREIARLEKRSVEEVFLDAYPLVREYIAREKLRKVACDGTQHAPGECDHCKHVFCVHGTDCGHVTDHIGKPCRKCESATRKRSRDRSRSRSKRIEKKRAETL